ncbi:MAG TPA: hypothetical protein VJH89_01670, partial [Patescibacteria group bacterium]|nr:hypothetical protein [Patescibacteria group bacterium]
ILLQQWAGRNGFELPDEKFFCEMRSDFGNFMKRIFPGFEMVTEEELSDGLNTLIGNNGLQDFRFNSTNTINLIH